VTIDERVYFPHSLGIFYSALTQFIGFPHYGDEYKVMGLAPYGKPNYLAQMRQIVRVQPDGTFRLALKYFRHHTANVSYSWNNCAPEVGTLYTQRLIDLLGPARKSGRTSRAKTQGHCQLCAGDVRGSFLCDARSASRPISIAESCPFGRLRDELRRQRQSLSSHPV
jgi:hypothetical protein